MPSQVGIENQGFPGTGGKCRVDASPGHRGWLDVGGALDLVWFDGANQAAGGSELLMPGGVTLASREWRCWVMWRALGGDKWTE